MLIYANLLFDKGHYVKTEVSFDIELSHARLCLEIMGCMISLPWL